jgi:hypothetical protein
MLQADAELPDVPRVPPPWSLRGNAWIVLLRLPATAGARRAFVPAELRDSVAAPVSAVMCVDYLEAPCGPYRELLFIPGSMRFGDGRAHLSISRILVSTWDSVVNGRANWGIPKDRADFDIGVSGRIQHCAVSEGGREFCRFEFGPPRGPRLPLRTGWVPAAFGTLAQRFGGRTYYYRPQARGRLRLCSLRSWRFDAALFPDLSAGRALASLRVEDFAMTFPVACVTDG